MKPKHLIIPTSMTVAATVLMLSACTTTEPDGFTAADTNKDGKVSLEETERYMLEAIYTQADADANAEVTFEEWKAANPKAEKEKFAVADFNKDGVVTPAEAETHFAKMGTMEDLFEKIDTDDSGFITREEAEAFDDKLEAESAAAETQP